MVFWTRLCPEEDCYASRANRRHGRVEVSAGGALVSEAHIQEALELEMKGSISRKQLFSGDFSGLRAPIRPPWALAEEQFLEACSQCGECITACAQGILKSGRGHYPQVDFQQGECTFCGDCVRQCQDAALSFPPPESEASPWQVRAYIGDGCLAWKSIDCRTCGEQCEQDAIFFRFSVRGIPRPELHADNCNGCGACRAPCPVDAITLRIL